MVKKLEQGFIYIGKAYFLKPLRPTDRAYTGLSNYTTISFDFQFIAINFEDLTNLVQKVFQLPEVSYSHLELKLVSNFIESNDEVVESEE